MDITSAECRELLQHLRFQVRGHGWVSVDETLIAEAAEEGAVANPFRELQSYLHQVQGQIAARSEGGLYHALVSLNQTLGKEGEGVREIMLAIGEAESRPMLELLPTEKGLREFSYLLRQVETFIANANYVERPDEPLGETPLPL